MSEPTHPVGERWLLPIPVLVAVAEFVYLVASTSVLMAATDMLLGGYIIVLRQTFALWLLRTQARVLQFSFGESEVQYSSFFLLCVGLGLVAAGLWTLLSPRLVAPVLAPFAA